MSKSIGICVIGGGAIADRHMQAYRQLGGVLPRWVVSRPAEAARDFARRWNFAYSGTSVEPALADPSVQLVLIASPSPLHSEQAVQAMQAGKDVIVEIPVALNWLDTQQVAQVAATLGRRIWVCHTLRSTAALRSGARMGAARKIVSDAHRGFLRHSATSQPRHGWNWHAPWVDNLLWHHGCHQVDAALWVLGLPAVPRVQALFGPVHPTLGMALDVGIQMMTAGGELITQSLTYNTEQPVWRLQFIGHEDVLTFENGRLTNEAGAELVPEAPTNDLTVQNRELIHAFLSGEKCEYDLPGVLATMEVLGRAQDFAAMRR